MRISYAQSDCGGAVSNALREWYDSLAVVEQEYINRQAQTIVDVVKAKNKRLMMTLDSAREIVLRIALLPSANGDLRNMVEVE